MLSVAQFLFKVCSFFGQFFSFCSILFSFVQFLLFFCSFFGQFCSFLVHFLFSFSIFVQFFSFSSFFVHFLLNFLLIFRIELNEEPSVKLAASIFRELCYNYRDQLMAGIIVAGWDRKEGGQVYSISIGGSLIRQPVAIGGSGSSYVYGFVDSNYKPGMTKDEAVAFATNSKQIQIKIHLWLSKLTKTKRNCLKFER